MSSFLILEDRAAALSRVPLHSGQVLMVGAAGRMVSRLGPQRTSVPRVCRQLGSLEIMLGSAR